MWNEFDSRNDLILHKRIYSGENRYECLECGKKLQKK